MGAQFETELDQMLDDATATFAETVTLTRLVLGAKIDTTPGLPIKRTGNTTDSQSVAANRVSDRRIKVRAGSGTRTLTQRIYEIQASLVTVGAGAVPAKGWRITDADGVELDVTEVELDANAKNYVITCEATA